MKKGLENPINKRVYNLRRRKRISEGELADSIGISRSTYRYHELDSHFTPTEIKKIADFFGVTVESLEDDTIDFTPKTSISRLSDVKDSYLVLGNTLIPSDLVLRMESLSTLPSDRRKRLLDYFDVIVQADEKNSDSLEKFFELFLENASKEKREILLNCFDLLFSDDKEKIEAIRKYIEFLNF